MSPRIVHNSALQPDLHRNIIVLPANMQLDIETSTLQSLYYQMQANTNLHLPLPLNSPGQPQRLSYQARLAQVKSESKENMTRTIRSFINSTSISKSNQMLIKAGFSPLDHSAWKRSMQIIYDSQNGLFDPATVLKIGKMANAQSILVLNFDIRVHEGMVQDAADIAIDAKIIDTQRGVLLAIGSVQNENLPLKRKSIEQTLELLFANFQPFS
ncbi:MAG: hypothetical protein KDK39_08095 [Leptospiraceae bacterium]|nr:hypothetical protein [Leptospiraceae bacterium]